MRRRLAPIALLLVAFTPAVAWAQAGWYITPSVTATEEFDDNVFSQSTHRESDFISRLAPNLKAGYQSKPFTLLASGGIDAEYFADHQDLSGVANRKRAGLELRYVPELTGPTTTLTLNVAYAESQTPAELQPQTGIEAGRRTTQLWTVAPALTHRFNLRTSGDASYSYSDTVSGGLSQVTQQARVGLSSQLTRLDTGTVHYTLSLIDSGGLSSTSHAFTLGWVSKLSHTTTLSLEAGPRLTDGQLAPQITAGLTHHFKIGDASLTYTRAETTVIGQAGVSETNSVLAALVLTPLRRLQLNLGAGFSNTSSGQGADILVYRANASVAYRLTKWLSLTANYRFSRQEQGSIQIPHNIFSIGLDAVYPIRAD